MSPADEIDGGGAHCESRGPSRTDPIPPPDQMIRHIVFFTARTPQDREAVYEGLKLLLDIPDRHRLEIGRNLGCDRVSPDGPDFVVYGEFEDEAQLATYKAHPLYQKAIDAVRPLRDMRIAADFLAG
jgi:hypothetical protein